MKKLGIVVVAVMFLLGAASMASAYMVYSNGPLNNVAIDFFVTNNGPGTINEVQFNLLSPYDIDTSTTPVGNDPVGVTSTFFAQNLVEANHYSKFGFTFTGFTNGAGTFSFNWDPDIIGDASYGAVISELAGTVVTLFATEGKYCGQMEIFNNDHLVANLCCFQPAPLPGSLLLLGSGLLGLVGFRFRKS